MGAYVGKTKNDGGKGVMVDYVYLDGAKFQPSDAEVKKMRACGLIVARPRAARTSCRFANPLPGEGRPLRAAARGGPRE
jgi:hypothetical protein